MHVETTWRKQALEQFERLPSALQQAALTLEQNLIDNPYVGLYSHTITLKDGTQAHIHRSTLDQLEAERTDVSVRSQSFYQPS